MVVNSYARALVHMVREPAPGSSSGGGGDKKRGPVSVSTSIFSSARPSPTHNSSAAEALSPRQGTVPGELAGASPPSPDGTDPEACNTQRSISSSSRPGSSPDSGGRLSPTLLRPPQALSPHTPPAMTPQRQPPSEQRQQQQQQEVDISQDGDDTCPGELQQHSGQQAVRAAARLESDHINAPSEVAGNLQADMYNPQATRSLNALIAADAASDAGFDSCALPAAAAAPELDAFRTELPAVDQYSWQAFASPEHLVRRRLYYGSSSDGRPTSNGSSVLTTPLHATAAPAGPAPPVVSHPRVSSVDIHSQSRPLESEAVASAVRSPTLGGAQAGGSAEASSSGGSVASWQGTGQELDSPRLSRFQMMLLLASDGTVSGGINDAERQALGTSAPAVCAVAAASGPVAPDSVPESTVDNDLVGGRDQDGCSHPHAVAAYASAVCAAATPPCLAANTCAGPVTAQGSLLESDDVPSAASGGSPLRQQSHSSPEQVPAAATASTQSLERPYSDPELLFSFFEVTATPTLAQDGAYVPFASHPLISATSHPLPASAVSGFEPVSHPLGLGMNRAASHPLASWGSAVELGGAGTRTPVAGSAASSSRESQAFEHSTHSFSADGHAIEAARAQDFPTSPAASSSHSTPKQRTSTVRDSSGSDEEEEEEGPAMSKICPLYDEYLPVNIDMLRVRQVELLLDCLRESDVGEQLLQALEMLARLTWTDEEVSDAFY